MQSAYIETPIKVSKAKDINLTKKHQTSKKLDELGAGTLSWILFKKFVRGVWRNKVPITVNAFLIENAYIVVHYGHFFK